MVPHKQQKMAEGKGRASLVESKEDQTVAKVRLQNPTWDARVEMDGVAIPWNSSIRES